MTRGPSFTIAEGNLETWLLQAGEDRPGFETEVCDERMIGFYLRGHWVCFALDDFRARRYIVQRQDGSLELLDLGGYDIRLAGEGSERVYGFVAAQYASPLSPRLRLSPLAAAES
jgi:hypothetical protein